MSKVRVYSGSRIRRFWREQIRGCREIKMCMKAGKIINNTELTGHRKIVELECENQDCEMFQGITEQREVQYNVKNNDRKREREGETETLCT